MSSEPKHLSNQAGSEADDLPIGKALRQLREGVGISQTEVARRGGPDFRTISHWETGRKHPTLRLLIQFLGVLKLDLCDLQAAFDRLAGRPDQVTGRLTTIEGRLSILERWRLEVTAAALDMAQEGNEPCEKSTGTLTES